MRKLHIRPTGSARCLHVCLAAAVLLTSSIQTARAQSASGTIEGLVVDQSGAALPGVTISVVQPAVGGERTVVSDGGGFFSAPLLPVGVYDLTATNPGFRAVKHPDLRLTVGATITLRLEMAIAGIAEAVTVRGGSTVLETSRSQASSTIDEVSVHNLPVNGRNFLDFVLLTPGVTRDVRQGDLSFAGQRGTLNSLVVDGADNNQTFAGQSLGRTGSGRAPYQLSQDVVREFQVNSNSFSAEYGRAGAGVINVVTRSGTNEFAGSAFEFYRDKALNANNAINVLNGRPKSPYHYHQFGGTIAGPLRVNRDFFFFNYDAQRNTQLNDVFLNLPPNTPDDPATRVGIERLRPLAYSWNRELDQDVFLIKTDHQLTSHRATLRYNHQDFTGTGYEQIGPQQSFEHTGDSLVRTRTLNATWAGVFGRRLFNEAKFQYARDHEPGTANSAEPEGNVRQGSTGVLLIGRNNFSPRANTIDRLQIADTLTWVRDVHKLKLGVDFQFDRIRNFFPGFFSGSYTFSSLASFASGRPDTYQQNFPGAGTSGAETTPDVHEYSFFVQDEWRLAPDVTLNLGLRYDLMKMEPPETRNPDPQLAAADVDTSRFENDTNNFGPRLGVAWNPRAAPYVIRGGWGLFFGRTPAVNLTAAGSNNGINIVSLTFTGDSAPTYPQKFTDIPGGGTQVRPNIFYIERNYASPRLMQANAAFEWMLGRHTSLAVTYLFVDGTSLPRSADRNIGTLGLRTYTVAGTGERVSYPVFGPDRPFANFTRVVAFQASAKSRYNGVTFELNRRFGAGTQFRVAYTLGKVVDTVPDATATLPGAMGEDFKHGANPQDFDVDRAVGNNDQRHRMVASAVFTTNGLADGLTGFGRTLAGGWWFSAIFTAQSGQPYSARVGGFDLNNDGNRFNDLAPGTRRNAFRHPAIVTFDPRVARDVPLGGRARLQLIWEAFNLFNRDNINFVLPAYYNVAGTTLSPSGVFGTPLSSAGERIIQLAARVAF